jgi:hypothetical protein
MTMTADDDSFNPTPEERKRIQKAHEAFQLMAGFSAPFITVIARTVAADEGEFVGSGFVVNYRNRALLVTAEHVATDAEAACVNVPNRNQDRARASIHRLTFCRSSVTV